MNTEKLNTNLGIIAAGLLIINLAMDLYDRFSRKNEKDGQESKNEDALPENDTQDSNDEKEEDDES